MQSAIILSFSGTGNTHYVANEMRIQFEAKGIKTSVYPMEKLSTMSNLPSLLAVDMVGIAFPVHAFNPPRYVENMIRSLPEIPGKKCFILKTAGSPFVNGGTTSTLKKILQRKKWLLQYETLVPMPPNLFARVPDSFIKTNLLMLTKQVNKITNDLICNKHEIIKASALLRFVCRIMRIEGWGAGFGGHYWKVEDSCIKCGKCVKECPSNNISFQNDRFSFGWKCSMCMRCSFQCPVQAFNNKLFGKWFMLKAPYNLSQIANDPSIKAMSLSDSNLATMKDFRKFWLKEDLID